MVRYLHPTTLKKLGLLTTIALGDGWPERIFFYVIGLQREWRGRVAQNSRATPRVLFHSMGAARCATEARDGAIMAPPCLLPAARFPSTEGSRWRTECVGSIGENGAERMWLWRRRSLVDGGFL